MEVEPDYGAWRQAMQQQFKLLEITDDHLRILLTLPLHHRDPFDRLLIARALSEDLTLLSRDTCFASYPVRVRW